MGDRQYEMRRSSLFERARLNGMPEAVAHLLSIAQEPRSDNETSTAAFDEYIDAESTQLRAHLSNAGATNGGLTGLGGTVEAAALSTAKRVLAAAEAEALPLAAAILVSAIERCRSLPRQRLSSTDCATLPTPMLIPDATTGRPIGMWR